MPLKQANLERQLTTAQSELDARDAELEGRGMSERERSKDASWRQLNARRSRLKSRMRAAAAVVERTEEAKRRKAEGPAEEDEKVDKKPSKKGAKAEAKPAKQDKKKGGGEGKS